MLASLAEGPFSHPDWIFEPKLDGYRIIAHIRDGKVTLLSRRGNNVTRAICYRLFLTLAVSQPRNLSWMAKIIAMDEKGRQCFQCLQNYLSSLRRTEGGQTGSFPLIYYVFDILYLDGYDLRDATLRSRKGLLHGILSRPTRSDSSTTLKMKVRSCMSTWKVRLDIGGRGGRLVDLLQGIANRRVGVESSLAGKHFVEN